MKLTKLKDLAAMASQMTEKTVIAVVEAHEEHTLEAVVQAAKAGIMMPMLIGNEDKINAILEKQGEAASRYSIIDTAGVEQSLKKAVELIQTNKANAIMKGKLESGQYLKAILSKENGIVSGGKLSLFALFEIPQYHKLLAVSDMGLNTYPDIEGKKAIVQNAVRLMHAIGIDNPKVAVLSSVEKLNPKMPDAVDAHALKTMNMCGEITECVIEGPISFDLATSGEAARIKGYDSPVAGDADILIVPDIAAGNMLVKSFTGFAGAMTAGTVLGAKIPIILTSRSAETSDKYYSIALAAYASAKY